MNVSESLYEIARCYQFGNDVPINPQMAYYCYIDSAKLGHSKAQYELALLLRNNSQEEYLPSYWLHKSAIQGNIDAIEFIHKNYHNNPEFKKQPYYKEQVQEQKEQDPPIEPPRKKQRTQEFVSGLDFYF